MALEKLHSISFHSLSEKRMRKITDCEQHFKFDAICAVLLSFRPLQLFDASHVFAICFHSITLATILYAVLQALIAIQTRSHIQQWSM